MKGTEFVYVQSGRKLQGQKIRPRPQAGAVCVREKTQGQKQEILLRATGRGERGATY
jgi:hypothetical protein